MTKTQTLPLSNISITEVEIDDRLGMFPKYFKKHYLRIEMLIYRWMARLCPSYNGGFWRMFELSNGGFYMSPSAEKSIETRCPGFGDSVTLSADAAGLVACLFAVNQLANDTEDDHIIRMYHLIRDYAGEHKEAAGIFRAID